MTDAEFAHVVGVVGAELFLHAKIKEYEAACFGGSKQRCDDAGENCRSALQALLDRKAEQAVFTMKNHRR